MSVANQSIPGVMKHCAAGTSFVIEIPPISTAVPCQMNYELMEFE